MGEQLVKMRATDLLRVLLDYCNTTDEDDREAWLAWNLAWDRADEECRRDALLIAATQLSTARKALHGSV